VKKWLNELVPHYGRQLRLRSIKVKITKGKDLTPFEKFALWGSQSLVFPGVGDKNEILSSLKALS